MSTFDGRKFLSESGEQLRLPIPRNGPNYVAILRITGTFTGTLKFRAGDPDGGFSDQTVRDVIGGGTGNPSSTGVYAIDLDDGADFFRALWDSYTSGEARVAVAFIADVT